MKSIIDILSFYDKSLASAGFRGQEIILRHIHSISQVMSLFSDDESRQLYAQEIVFCALCQIMRMDLVPYFTGLMTNDEFSKYVDCMRSHKLFSLFEAPEDERSDAIKAMDMTATFLLEQYRYKDLVCVEEGDICLDCGAFIGDTALYFTEGKPEKIYSFEIDHGNLKYLRANIENFGKTDVVEIVEQALGNRCSSMYYVPMHGNVSGGHIAEESDDEGSYQVDVTTIDEFCERRKIVTNFIKMDIEGAELDAIDGARKTIQKHHPKLAVCIYHKMEHRWEIPILVHEISPEYRLYLKKSQPYGETVLFAVL